VATYKNEKKKSACTLIE